MFKKVAVLATVILMSSPLFVTAEESERRKPSPEERLERMQKHLDLSDDQVLQIQEIHENGGGKEEVGAILTEAQRAKMGKHRGSKSRLKHMQKQLDLSDEQISQIREIRSNGGNREDVAKVLTEEQRSQMKAHRAQSEHRRGHGEDSGDEDKQ